MHIVKKVEYLHDYKLRLRFEGDTLKIVDLKSHLDGEIFEPLKEQEYFRQVVVDQDLDTIVWPNGADFSPDFLFEIGAQLPEQTSV